jgi:hypothetical protein
MLHDFLPCVALLHRCLPLPLLLLLLLLLLSVCSGEQADE